MATQKPISTISYNSVGFLKEKLDTWVKAHIIQAYQFIVHKGEDGDKDHIHVRVEPNKKLDQMDLTDQLKEYVLDNPKPLGCRPWRPSKEEDWFLYAVHDDKYLKLKYGGGDKGEKLPYNFQDIVVSDGYDLEVAFVRAKAYLEHTTVNIATRIQQGENPLALVLQGENPYIVNSIMHTVADNDYMRLNRDFQELQGYMSQIRDELFRLGFQIVEDSSGKIEITQRSDCLPSAQSAAAQIEEDTPLWE